MRNQACRLIGNGILLVLVLSSTICLAMPQVATTTSSTPSVSPAIPWPEKIQAFRSFLVAQPDQNATKGFCTGPTLSKTFDDGECLQMRLCNWDCSYEEPYKMRGVVQWLDDTIPRDSDPIWDPWRYYEYGYYKDPDDGWSYYDTARLSFGACGNRGPQSACGVVYCVGKDGKPVNDAASVPQGQTPWLDPNDRNRLCPWLRNNETSMHQT
ncbi:hypothetical protein ACEQ8H_008993 [Pleosporales sp. CAS-2024a]